MSEIKNNSRVNQPLNANCRLCHMAGFSNLCTFSMGGECPYISLRKNLAKDIVRA